jgi:hypothetical protein
MLYPRMYLLKNNTIGGYKKVKNPSPEICDFKQIRNN